MTNEKLHQNFVYEPESGMLRKTTPGARKAYPWRNIGAGYLATTFERNTYYLHRLVWQYHTGEDPTMVDHKNGDKKDCRIGNLRICTPSQNQYNGPRKKNNALGAKGVVFHPKCKSRPYQAKVVSLGRTTSIGYYSSVAEAASAYRAALTALAGEFARGD